MATETKKVLRSITEVMKGLKGDAKKAGLGRKLGPAETHSNALLKFTRALQTAPTKAKPNRGWKHTGSGKYVLGPFTVETHEDYKKGFTVLLDGDIPLPLGKGCIDYVDNYVKAMKIMASAK